MPFRVVACTRVPAAQKQSANADPCGMTNKKSKSQYRGLSASVEMTGLGWDISGFQRVLEKSF